MTTATVSTYDTWLRHHPDGNAEVHCGGEHPIAGRIRAARSSSEWTPERLLLAAIELATCRQFLQRVEREGLALLTYESSALARVRTDDAGPHLLDVTFSLYVAVTDRQTAERVEGILAELANEPLMGLALNVPRQVIFAVEVIAGNGRREVRTAAGKQAVGTGAAP